MGVVILLEIVYSNHAEERVIQRNISKRYLNVLIESMPPFTGLQRWRFQNGYFVVLSHQNGIILVVTCGIADKFKPRGKRRDPNEPRKRRR
jgi:hypothetical protein